MDNINKINDMKTYIGSMSKTLYDKCWWIDKIPDSINTVIDYGCAQGDLAVMINRIDPSKNWKYVGVDSSPEMLAIAKHNFAFHFTEIDADFTDDISEALNKVDPNRTILILNSVLHEVYSYLSEQDQDILFAELFKSGIRYIAIRDMCRLSDHNYRISVDLFESVETSEYNEKWDTFKTLCKRRKDESSQDENLQMQEFLLKYRYDINWKRESHEQYLWDWFRMLTDKKYIGFCSPYDCIFRAVFNIPFLSQRVEQDFGCSWKEPTHMKALFCLR